MKHLFSLPLCLILTSAALTAAPVVQQAYVKAPNSDAGDSLGSSTAIFGDTLVVGAPYEDGSGSGVNPPPDDALADSGAAYVYVRSGGVWTFQAYLKASNPSAGDLFGYSVAIAGNTIIVGAPSEDGSGTGINPASDELLTDSGAAYVFVRTGNTWTQQAYVKASNTDDGDGFGGHVAIHGDTVVVTASLEDGSGTGVNPTSNELAHFAGAAYVFVRNSTTWSQQAYLKASNSAFGDGFGSAVAISGDTIVVGASGEDGSGSGINPASDDLATGAGAAYVFTRSGTTWGFDAYLKASNTGANDSFGVAVTISGEIIVIGAQGEDGSGTGVNPPSDELASVSGAAYAFVRSGTTWSQQAYLKPSNTGATDSFGESLSLSGNVLVVGATGEDGSGTGVNPASNESSSLAGAAYVFSHAGTTWTQNSYLKASQLSIQDNFGTSVAASADTVVIGAPGEDGSGTGINPAANELAGGAGAAFVFSGIDIPEIAVSQNSTDIPNGGSKSFGNMLQGDTANLSFTISNSGTAGLTLSGSPLVAVSGQDASAFTITSQPTSPVAASGSTTFTVHFNATTAGSRSALLTILNEDVSESIFRIQLSAEVLPPDIAISQQGLNIPSGGSQQVDPVSVGFFSDMTFDITNTGAATLLLTGSPAISISGPDAASFSILAQPNATVPTGVTRSFTLRFTPLDGALKNALLTIASNDADESPYQIAISGQAPPPQIQVTQGSNTLSEGSDFGGVILGGTVDQVFTIDNLGGVTLNLTGSPLVEVFGTNASSFTVTAQPVATLVPGGQTTFTVRFAPATLGTKNASLRILSNDAQGNHNKVIGVYGTALNFTNDTDGDGLNDGSELQMAALGFKWNLNQPALVNTLMSNAANAGLYTTSQVQALNVGTPLIQKNATTGAFTLTLGLEKSTNLSSFTSFPMTAPQCTINGQGKLEFQFTVPDNAAFFRVQAQ